MELFILATTALAWGIAVRYAVVEYLKWKQEKNS